MKMAYKIIISANYEIWALHGIIHKQRAGVQRMAEGSEVCMAGMGATGACCWFSKQGKDYLLVTDSNYSKCKKKDAVYSQLHNRARTSACDF